MRTAILLANAPELAIRLCRCCFVTFSYCYSNLGKVVRINRDGTIPQGQPVRGQVRCARGNVSLGHRNMLAAAVHPSTGQLWVVEMGPLGGDELNVIERGANYGWPVVSNGDNYDKSPDPRPPHEA